MDYEFSNSTTPFEVDIWLANQIADINDRLNTGDFSNVLSDISTLKTKVATLEGNYTNVNTTLTNLSTTVNNHIANKNNPHAVNKSHVGLSNVENYKIATTQEAYNWASNTTYMTPLKTKELLQKRGGTLELGTTYTFTSGDGTLDASNLDIGRLYYYKIMGETIDGGVDYEEFTSEGTIRMTGEMKIAFIVNSAMRSAMVAGWINIIQGNITHSPKLTNLLYPADKQGKLLTIEFYTII